MNNFRSKEWGYNGPKLLTRVLENQVCHTSLSNMTPELCGGFRVFPVKEFYPVNYDDWEQLFIADQTENVLHKTRNSSVVHIWSHLSRDKIITKSNRKSAYEAIAEKNCPNVFKSTGKYF